MVVCSGAAHGKKDGVVATLTELARAIYIFT